MGLRASEYLLEVLLMRRLASLGSTYAYPGSPPPGHGTVETVQLWT